jgi:hypothetical protein
MGDRFPMHENPHPCPSPTTSTWFPPQITGEQAAWRASDNMPTAEQIVRHVAWAKTKYCHDGFGVSMVLADPSVNEDGDHASVPWEFPCGAGYGLCGAPAIHGAIDLLTRAHAVVVECLHACTEEALDHPVPGRHGKSAGHLFSILMIHDIYHAGQIRTRRALCAASQAD